MKKPSFNENPILHILLGIFLALETFIYATGAIGEEIRVVFVIFSFISAYLCYFHFRYAFQIRKQAQALHEYDETERSTEHYQKYNNKNTFEESLNNVEDEESDFDIRKGLDDGTNEQAKMPFFQDESDGLNETVKEKGDDDAMPDSTDINNFFRTGRKG